eukprot:364743-Chlamydomonas_euryale.AAC.73
MALLSPSQPVSVKCRGGAGPCAWGADRAGWCARALGGNVAWLRPGSLRTSTVLCSNQEDAVAKTLQSDYRPQYPDPQFIKARASASSPR